MDELGELQTARWRPLHVRGIPVHLVAPVIALLLGLSLLVSGGLASVLGAWVLTAGFPLAIGAFVADPRAAAAPAIVWAGWLAVVHLAGSGSSLPRTPVLLAMALAGLGAAAVWLAQRAVLPAVEGVEPDHTRNALPDLDELLAPPQVPRLLEDEANAEVDEALSELLEEPIDEAELEGAEREPDDDEVDGEAAIQDDAAEPPAVVADGQVIEFEAIRED